jgi:saccharopine dehydrogenase (NAD+, L-lysine-forming)
MLLDRLLAAGVEPVLAGRNPDRLARQAQKLDLDHRAFSLTDGPAADAALADIDVVLHAAGPFVDTGPPMMDACIRTRTHYLDLAGEWPVFAEAERRSSEAARAGIMLMPGVGFSVVMSDCLLALVAARTPGAVKLRLAVSRPDEVSAASVRSMASLIGPTVLVREAGMLRERAAGALRHDVDFGAGLAETTAVCWPFFFNDTVTTVIYTIETYAETDWLQRLAHAASASASRWQNGRTRALAAGLFPLGLPGGKSAAGFTLVAQAVDRWRRASGLSMRTLGGYAVSAITGEAIARRVLDGDCGPGWRTPAGQFGGDFALGLGCATLIGRRKLLSVQGA